MTKQRINLDRFSNKEGHKVGENPIGVGNRPIFLFVVPAATGYHPVRQYIDDYKALSAMYDVVRKAYTKKVYVDKEFQRKTNELVREHVGACGLQLVDAIIEIDETTIEIIKMKEGGDNTKIINLVKCIERIAEEQSDDPYLIAMAERAKAVQENYENRQTTTSEALDELLKKK